MSLVCAGLFTGWAAGDDVPMRLPVPNTETLRAADKQVRDIFQTEFAAAKRPTEKSALAEKLRQGYQTSQGIPIAALTIQRFRGSDGSVLVTTDSYFSRPASKDTTQYLFEGKTLGKGRLALAIVKRHVEANPAITFAELEKAFPKSCQGSVGVVATVDQANHIYSTSGRKRHFLDPEDLIQVQDVSAAVSSQWGIGNIDRLLKRAGELGYKVQAVDG